MSEQLTVGSKLFIINRLKDELEIIEMYAIKDLANSTWIYGKAIIGSDASMFLYRSEMDLLENGELLSFGYSIITSNEELAIKTFKELIDENT